MGLDRSARSAFALHVVPTCSSRPARHTASALLQTRSHAWRYRHPAMRPISKSLGDGGPWERGRS